ncbi:MAG: patatin-like phospholipase family protein [Clostridia bacterium]|nr:patatin-like phospholipase family protein [Clostridia bacterium]
MSVSGWMKNLFKKPTTRKIEQDTNQVLHPLKLGLAFSGGGTRGIAYIGVIKAFNEAGLKFDFISGTSVGSLMGAAYSAGLLPEEMEKIAKSLKVKDIRTSKINFVPSKTDKLIAVVREALEGRSFQDLKIPFTAVAVDIITAKEVHVDSGDLPTAIAGSCAVPGVFNPVEYGEYRFFDGGIMNNIPADVVREMGADIVLAVDINPTRGYGTDSTKYLEVMKAALRILMKANSVKGYVHSDYVLKIDLSQYDQTKLDGIDDMIRIGYEVTKQEMPNILKVLGMRVPDENIKETARRLKQMQRKAKQIAKVKKTIKNEEEKNVLGQVQRGEKESEASAEQPEQSGKDDFEGN